MITSTTGDFPKVSPKLVTNLELVGRVEWLWGCWEYCWPYLEKIVLRVKGLASLDARAQLRQIQVLGGIYSPLK